MDTFARRAGVKVIRVDAGAFSSALKGIADPEQKRSHHVCSSEVFEEERRRKSRTPNGLLRHHLSDVIESAAARTRKAYAINNQITMSAACWSTCSSKLLEPLRAASADEVRAIGIGIICRTRWSIVIRSQGRAWGVRILGEVKRSTPTCLLKADAIYLEELYRHDLYDKISQAFAVFLLAVKWAAVLGDARAYDYVIVLRAVETVDFMTAIWARIPYEVLATISNRIINEVRGISRRVVYDISGKPPATIEWGVRKRPSRDGLSLTASHPVPYALMEQVVQPC